MSTNSVINPAAYVPSNISNMMAPLYPQAVILPLLAFPSWILCIPPLFWQLRQGNISAGSLILWVMMINFFNSINPLIWPRDNITQWWDGNVWCDINVRIQVGAIVGTTASTAMIVRRLAMVMDTSNMTVSPGRNSKLKEKALEILWCWVYPLILIIVYYFVQPVRYLIYGIIGCLAAYDTSWPSIVLSFMWAPITTMIAACYAGVLSYRLYRYRREFARLVAARNTTKSRFIRLFIICIIIVTIYVPYTLWLLVVLCRAVVDPYSWSRVHDPQRFDTVVKVPTFGQVTVDRWGEVVTGYIIFFVFGTGSDAYNTYKKMLLIIGFGKCFSSLYARENASSSPNSFIAARTWTSNLSSKAKSIFWSKTGSVTGTFDDTTRSSSIALGSMPRLTNVTTEEPILQQDTIQQPSRPSFLSHLFTRKADQRPGLPFFSHRSRFFTEITEVEANKRDQSPGASAHAWATGKSSSGRISEADGVRVVREVHLDRQERDEQAKERESDGAWA